jgi:outer membrane immunogenic protein
MGRVWLRCAVSASLLFPVLASAADLPAYKALPAAVAVSWSGFYIGGNVGYGWGRARSDAATPGFLAPGALSDFPIPGFTSSDPFHLNGVIGGGQIGWNSQFGRWVIGLEADLQASGQKDSQDATAAFNLSGGGGTVAFGSTSASFETKLLWLGTVRGRLGFLAADNLLFFATGGLAYGGVKVAGDGSVTGTYVGGPVQCLAAPNCPIAGNGSFGRTTTQFGWTLGAGIEGRTWLQNWTWKIEYLYVDLGTAHGTATFGGTLTSFEGTAALSGNVPYSVRLTDQIARVGLNYRFASDR